ncbi:MAG: hypothetical protein KI790_13025 [Cyclobacteriaceae bacterium]|nr:hypothetical protein [Cyclobacteriaceae bacterium HetDA_MAG_MS6]
MRKFILLVIVAYLAACNTSQQQPPLLSASEKAMPKALKACFDAHGGLKNWRTQKTLSYVRNDNENHLVDLTNRKVRVDASAYQLGFDGQEVWVTPDSAAFGKGSPRFFHNLWFYFFSLPFMAADPGVILKELPEVTFNGTAYDRVLMAYESGIGDSPDDQYVLYINKETSTLDLINYSVTYYDNTKATSYNALVFEGWNLISGIKVPTSLTGYRWKNDTLGNQRYQVKFSEVQFEQLAPDQTVFEKPNGAYIAPRN